MSIPWTDVLDYACVWAASQSSSSTSAEKIVQQLYNNSGFIYDTYAGQSRYTSFGEGSMNLTLFLSELGSTRIVNCYDMGKAITIFANAIGCNASYRYSQPFGYLNCIKPIGKGWTNNPFYDGYVNGIKVWTDPIVGEDTSWYPTYEKRSYFGNHAFGSIGDNIYDATLKVDIDGNPDYGPPFSESWATGWNWDTYKSRVVDNYPSTSTSYPSIYYFSVY